MGKKKSDYQSDAIKTKLYSHQKEVINFLRSNEVSILIGPAGTSKDFTCLYRGLDGLNNKEFEEIVLIKPMIEVGKGIGFLPGDSLEKYAPYEKSFHDNIKKMLTPSMYSKLKNKIVFEPISFLRGNTFEYSLVILSEAQNCTLHELMTVATRISHNSRLYLNGDLTQSDIGRKSGLKDFLEVMSDVNGVDVMELGDEHQVRNKLIVDMNKSYSRFLKRKNV